MIIENLDFNPHRSSIVTKANICISFINRNISNWPKQSRELAYLSPVRSQFEYGVIWDPYQMKNISRLDYVQIKAAKFIKQDYSKYNSVS